LASYLKLGLITCLILTLSAVRSLHAQGSSFLDETNLTIMDTGGNIGVTASGYSVDGIENRRAPGMIQTNANMNFTLFGFSSGLNMNYSTDDSELRQNMNAMSFNAMWRWVNIQAGDINTQFSQYGLGGATIRGGYLRLDPGNYLLELTGGR